MQRNVLLIFFTSLLARTRFTRAEDGDLEEMARGKTSHDQATSSKTNEFYVNDIRDETVDIKKREHYERVLHARVMEGDTTASSASEADEAVFSLSLDDDGVKQREREIRLDARFEDWLRKFPERARSYCADGDDVERKDSLGVAKKCALTKAREAIFLENQRRVERHNEALEKGWPTETKLELSVDNQFADLTKEEYDRMMEDGGMRSVLDAKAAVVEDAKNVLNTEEMKKITTSYAIASLGNSKSKEEEKEKVEKHEGQTIFGKTVIEIDDVDKKKKNEMENDSGPTLEELKDEVREEKEKLINDDENSEIDDTIAKPVLDNTTSTVAADPTAENDHSIVEETTKVVPEASVVEGVKETLPRQFSEKRSNPVNARVIIPKKMVNSSDKSFNLRDIEDATLDPEFTKFVFKYDKREEYCEDSTWPCEIAFSKQDVFLANVQEIDKENFLAEKRGSHMRKGITRFADLTQDEFEDLHATYVPKELQEDKAEAAKARIQKEKRASKKKSASTDTEHLQSSSASSSNATDSSAHTRGARKFAKHSSRFLEKNDSDVATVAKNVEQGEEEEEENVSADDATKKTIEEGENSSSSSSSSSSASNDAKMRKKRSTASSNHRSHGAGAAYAIDHERATSSKKDPLTSEAEEAEEEIEDVERAEGEMKEVAERLKQNEELAVHIDELGKDEEVEVELEFNEQREGENDFNVVPNEDEQTKMTAKSSSSSPRSSAKEHLSKKERQEQEQKAKKMTPEQIKRQRKLNKIKRAKEDGSLYSAADEVAKLGEITQDEKLKNKVVDEFNFQSTNNAEDEDEGTENVIDVQIQEFNDPKSNETMFKKHFDWRHKIDIGPVYSQGACSGCWAYSTVQVIADSKAIATGTRPDLSPYHLLSCDNLDSGCHTGNMATAYAWIGVQRDGILRSRDFSTDIVSEEECPVPSNLGSSGEIIPDSKAPEIRGINIDGYCEIAPLEGKTTIAALMRAVKQQPIAVGLNVKPLQLYGGGLVQVADCPPASTDSVTAINHAAVIVGWGMDDVAKKPYWLIKNSYGVDWGEDGYARIAMELTEGGAYGACGLYSEQNYPLTDGRTCSEGSDKRWSEVQGDGDVYLMPDYVLVLPNGGGLLTPAKFTMFGYDVTNLLKYTSVFCFVSCIALILMEIAQCIHPEIENWGHASSSAASVTTQQQHQQQTISNNKNHNNVEETLLTNDGKKGVSSYGASK